jgi:Fe-S cluster assembly iron-binding protein IscA
MDSVTAEIKLRLRIKSSGCWGKNCKLEQIEKQALESVMQQLSKGLNLERHRIKLITKPECLNMIISKPLDMDFKPKKTLYKKCFEFVKTWIRKMVLMLENIKERF